MAKVAKKTKKATSKKISTSRSKQELKDFKLGEVTNEYPSTYSPKVLEAFDNKNPGKDAWTTFVCTEFTSLCPKTNQPDFARIFINYIADKKMVESKSLKLYLFSFRNHGDFHEDCVQKICDDLTKLMKPKFIEVIGEFTHVVEFPFFLTPVPQAQQKNTKKSKTIASRLMLRVNLVADYPEYMDNSLLLSETKQ